MTPGHTDTSDNVNSMTPEEQKKQSGKEAFAVYSDTSDYNKRDHVHCPQTNSPCGLEGEHRCCLCEKPVDTSD